MTGLADCAASRSRRQALRRKEYVLYPALAGPSLPRSCSAIYARPACAICGLTSSSSADICPRRRVRFTEADLARERAAVTTCGKFWVPATSKRDRCSRSHGASQPSDRHHCFRKCRPSLPTIEPEPPHLRKVRNPVQYAASSSSTERAQGARPLRASERPVRRKPEGLTEVRSEGQDAPTQALQPNGSRATHAGLRVNLEKKKNGTASLARSCA